MKNILISFLFFVNGFIFSQNDSCLMSANAVKARILVIDETNAISKSNISDKYQLVLLEVLGSKTIPNRRIVVRNFFKVNLKEGKIYNVRLQKLNSNCWPMFQSKLLIESQDEIYRVME